ncbi:hypothetical protein NL676_022179 [Syzygium grande]|nr:hypothetical protein NL676_022179 [Syzygium grande]
MHGEEDGAREESSAHAFPKAAPQSSSNARKSNPLTLTAPRHVTPRRARDPSLPPLHVSTPVGLVPEAGSRSSSFRFYMMLRRFVEREVKKTGNSGTVEPAGARGNRCDRTLKPGIIAGFRVIPPRYCVRRRRSRADGGARCVLSLTPEISLFPSAEVQAQSWLEVTGKLIKCLMYTYTIIC